MTQCMSHSYSFYYSAFPTPGLRYTGLNLCVLRLDALFAVAGASGCKRVCIVRDLIKRAQSEIVFVRPLPRFFAHETQEVESSGR